jgi:hypothetical protein
VRSNFLSKMKHDELERERLYEEQIEETKRK